MSIPALYELITCYPSTYKHPGLYSLSKGFLQDGERTPFNLGLSWDNGSEGCGRDQTMATSLSETHCWEFQWRTSKSDKFTQCWCDVGPASQTVGPSLAGYIKVRFWRLKTVPALKGLMIGSTLAQCNTLAQRCASVGSRLLVCSGRFTFWWGYNSKSATKHWVRPAHPVCFVHIIQRIPPLSGYHSVTRDKSRQDGWRVGWKPYTRYKFII